MTQDVGEALSVADAVEAAVVWRIGMENELRFMHFQLSWLAL